MSKTRYITLVAMLCALAIAFNLAENMMALPLGVRVGFANVIAMIAIELFGIKEMILINLVRVMISGLLSGIIFSYPWFMSVAGVSISTCLLILLHAYHASSVFTGIICAFGHDLGQIVVLSLVISSKAFIPYLFIMFIVSLIAGAFTGIVSEKVTQRMKNIFDV